MHKKATLFLVLVSSIVSCLSVLGGETNVFSSDVEIQATNIMYDGRIIVVTNCTLTIDGAHAFESVYVMGTGKITHSACTTDEVFSLDLTVADTVLVDSNATIDVSEKGYMSGRTYGNTTIGAASGVSGWGCSGCSGGSYGGIGSGDSPNWVYGDYRLPNEWGSGGGAGGPGGGLIKLTSANLVLNGKLIANGGADCSGGSGGGICLDVVTLSGTGSMEANGGGVNGDFRTAGGGGRIAVYFDSVLEFDLTNSLSAVSGQSRTVGSAGTVYVYDKAVGGTLVVRNFGTPHAGWTPLGSSNDTVLAEDQLIVSGTNSVAVPYQDMYVRMTNVYVINGGLLSHRAATNDAEYSLKLSVAQTVTVDTASAIDVSAKGYGPNRTRGNSPVGAATGDGSGSYGGLGGGDYANRIYGDEQAPNEPGSGGAGTGTGGGVACIFADTLDVDGAIRAKGSKDEVHNGSGGSILVSVNTLSGAGELDVRGGGSNGDFRTGGGGGRLAVYYSALDGFSLDTNQVYFSGGIARTPGADGTFVASSGTCFVLDQPFADIAHDTTVLGWKGLGVPLLPSSMELTCMLNGQTMTQITNLPVAGTYDWNTSALADGFYTVLCTFSVSGQPVGVTSRQITVNNGVTYHSGRIESNENWSAGTIHVVDADVIVENGAVVTIEPGAVVKVADEVGIMVYGTMDASGAAGTNVYFTSFKDDAIGGDTNLDGDRSVPAAGAWLGLGVDGGSLLLSENTTLRYGAVTHSGTVASNETWLGSFSHVIRANITIPSDVTVTVGSGAVVKMATNVMVSVEGKLQMNGTVSQPIYVTSIKDDAVGGDTNGDGTESMPAPGDWNAVYVHDGTGIFSHVYFQYGGAENTPWGSIRTEGEGALALLDRCSVSDSLYESLIAYPSGSIYASNTMVRGAIRGVNSDRAGYIKLVNCTVYDCDYGIWGHGGRIDVCNTIIAFCRVAGINNVLGSTIRVNYCDVYTPGGTDYARMTDQTGLNGNISINPAFVNVTNSNFRLNYLSPCIDAADTTNAPATDFMDAPRVNDPRTTVKHGVADANGIYADMGAYEFTKNAESDVDLIVTEITGPPIVCAGEAVTVTWKVCNAGRVAISNTWHDEVRFCPVVAGKWDTAKVVTQRLTRAALGVGQTIENSEQVTVPGGTEGRWAWTVHCNVLGEVFEGQYWNNNVTSSETDSELQLIELAVDSTNQGMYVSEGSPVWYKVRQPADEGIYVELNSRATSGVCRIYAGHDNMPSDDYYDAVSAPEGTTDPMLGIASGAARDVYLCIVPEQLSQGAELQYSLVVRKSSFSVTGAGLETIGTDGRVTLPVRGDGFTRSANTYLKNGITVLEAVTNVLYDSSSLYAVFDVDAAEPGYYDLIVVQNGVTGSLAAAVQLMPVNCVPPEFHVLLPPVVRQGRWFDGVLEYGNDGNVDTGPVLATLKGASGNVRFMYGDYTNEVTSFNIVTLNRGCMPCDALPPGITVDVPFKAQALSGSQVSYTVTYVDTNDTLQMDYVALEVQIRPPHPHPLWTQAWSYVSTECGALRGQYIAALASAAERAAEYGQSLVFEREILEFMIREAFEIVQDMAVGGTLVDASGDAVARKRILLNAVEGWPTGTVYSTTTWFDGSFRWSGVSTGEYVLSAPGYLPTNLANVSVVNTNISVYLNMITATSRCAVLRGRITEGGTGLGIRNALLTVQEAPGGELYSPAVGDDGCYELDVLQGGSYRVNLSAEGWAPVVPREISLEAGQTMQLDFALTQVGGTISGIVYSALASPVTGAVVVVEYADGPTAYGDWTGMETCSDSNGWYSFSGLPEGRYTLRGSATGEGEALPLSVSVAGSSDRLRQDISLNAGHTITGRVIDILSSNAISGAVIFVEAYPRPAAYLTNDASGFFTMENLSTGQYQVTVQASGYQPGVAEVEVLTNGAAPFAVGLVKQGEVNGHVQTGTKSIAGMSVSLLSAVNEQVWTTETDAQGNYAFTGLFTGAYSVVIGNVNEGASSRFTSLNITSTNAVNVCDYSWDYVFLTGRVFHAGGVVAHTNASVYLISKNEQLACTETDSSGGYSFSLFETGVYSIVAMSDDSMSAVVSNLVVADGVTQKNITMPNKQFIVNVTRLADGTVVTNATVELQLLESTCPALTRIRNSEGPEGRYVFTNIPLGTYCVSAWADGLAYITSNYLLDADMGELPIALDVAGILSGCVTANNEPVGQAEINIAVQESGRIIPGTLTDVNGAFTVDYVPSGTITLAVVPIETDLLPQTVNVVSVPGVTVTQLFELLTAPTSVLSGTVVDANNQQVAGASVELMTDEGARLRYTRSDNNGSFELTGWPTGRLRIKAAAAGYEGTESQLVVTSGVSVTNVQLVLSTAKLVAQEGIELIPTIQQILRGRGFIQGTIDIIREILDGSMGIPDPLFYHKNLGLKEDMFSDRLYRYMDPYWDAKENGTESCNGVRSTYVASRNWSKNVTSALAAWRQNYKALKEMNQADVRTILGKAALLTSKATAIMGAWALPEATATTYAGSIAAAQTFQTFAEWAGTIQELTIEGSIDTKGLADINASAMASATTILNAYFTGREISSSQAVKRLNELAASYAKNGHKMAAKNVRAVSTKFADEAAGLDAMGKSKLVKYGGRCLDVLGVINDFQNLRKKCAEDLQRDVIGRGLDYIRCSDTYYKAADSYLKGAKTMQAAINDCKTGDGGDPNNTKPVSEPTNNGGSANNGIVGSRDPNDKLATGISGTYIRSGSRIYYTIRFENVATASAPAQVVTVTDVLSKNLDWSTVELGDIGFNNVTVGVPAGLQHFSTNGIAVATDSNPVSLDASLALGNGTLSWTIQSVDPVSGELPADPLAGFLPPNTTNETGEGYVSFSVCIKSNMVTGTYITNVADIVFDNNNAIQTPVVTNVLDSHAPTSEMPLLASRVPRIFTVSWSGDDAAGSGIARYDVYVSVNSNAYFLWVGTEATSGTYTGIVRSTYDFLVRAVDNVGNMESKSVPDASTTVGAPLKNDFDGDGRSDIGCYYDVEGFWYIYKSMAGFWTTQYGYDGTKPISGDFDGDNLCDYGTYAAGAGQWNIMRSTEGPWDNNFGYAGTVPVTGDFDGDGLCDFGCYYAPGGNWYLYKSKDGFWVNNFGYEGTVPVTGDFDGDGVADFGCFYAPGGNWYLYKSKDGFWTTQFGYEGTLPVTGDFDGDGLCDFGCYYPEGGNWYIYKSRDGFWVNNFGYAGTLPISGDYDGDVIDDFGCYYAPGGNWYIYRSSEGFYINQFGYEGTVPVGE